MRLTRSFLWVSVRFCTVSMGCSLSKKVRLRLLPETERKHSPRGQTGRQTMRDFIPWHSKASRLPSQPEAVFHQRRNQMRMCSLHPAINLRLS